MLHKEYLECGSIFLLSCRNRKYTQCECRLMLNNHYFIDDLHLSLWQEQEKSTKQVQERWITELVKNLLHLVWKPLPELAALGTDLPTGGWEHSSRGGFVARRICCVGQGAQHSSGEALQPEGHVLGLKSCQCCSMFEALLGVIDNMFLLWKMMAFILHFILMDKEDLITGYTVNWEGYLLYLHKTSPWYFWCCERSDFTNLTTV